MQENTEFFIDRWKENEAKYINLDFKAYDVLKPVQKQSSSFGEQFMAVVKREFQILARDPR